MEGMNHTSVTEFILLGITTNSELEVLLFVIFMLVYILTLLGNSVICLLIVTDPHLHTPMYYFLCNLSFVDLCYSSSITPNMLMNLISVQKIITFSGCAVQLFCFTVFGNSESVLLGVMAYDRYVAICKPLLYPVIMNQKTCVHFAVATYLWSVLSAVGETILTFSLYFCRSNIIDHFFCDFSPLLKLSCSDTTTNEVVIFIFVTFVGISSCGIITTSYCYIISTILRIQSLKGRYKAFSTCASHFTLVSLFFGTIFIMYLQPQSSSSKTQSKVLSLFYTVMIPMLNPMIYSLRNHDVKRALRKLVH
ncbi:olfactory receptor 5AR1-like [Pleurodeles waltl]|uniref:olfactory receptor 5AR1-like n=1 Tax=Pleurodeles waltl TaxID=8319 RepID=UPI0037097C0D